MSARRSAGPARGVRRLAVLARSHRLIDERLVAESRTGVRLCSRRVRAGAVDLHVISAGPEDGTPVLLLHGFPECWFSWHRHIAVLAQAGYRVLAPDLKGYNRSDKPRVVALYDAEHLVQDILNLMDTLKLRSALMAGHDIGGKLLWRLALLHPQRVRKAVIFNSVHPFAWEKARPQDDEGTISWFREFLRLPWLPELVGRAGNFWLLTSMLRRTSRPGTFEGPVMDVYRSAWRRDGAISTMFNSYRTGEQYGIDPERVEKAAGAEPEIRVIWGSADKFFPPAAARLTAELVGADAFVDVPGASHWILLEEPELTVRSMLDFFASSERRAHENPPAIARPGMN